ncbi:hypothetical protein H312_02864 [Anncaliia algerae PRA339]|uniref:DNA-(apurinic or apyrimidinic site) lyase n=1 Tax=Anncaliia algerae PRA339 TaxID=1288291 RepID=A0A059EYF2_9MICR|nr:hypothetical protein H312_02864 [Anncaliia algerae PRA339]
MLYHLETKEYINLELTLFSGQIFSFKKTDCSSYTGVFNNEIITFHQRDKEVYYDYSRNIQKELEYFFTLDISYIPLLLNWRETCNFYKLEYNGLRLLRCDLLECIFTFICSSNNTVKRITQMVSYLFSKGKYLGTINDQKFYAFPTLDKLNDVDDLINNKFGYRAEYVCKTAEKLINYSNDYKILRNKCLEKDFLVSLHGIGNKVSDCIKLMALEQFNIVPIDTHIYKAMKLIFNDNRKLSKSNYKEFQERFYSKFGDCCGIAQLYIFKEYLDKNILKKHQI